MAPRQPSRKASTKSLSRFPTTQDYESANENISDAASDEEDLERLVLGDGANFKAQLSAGHGMDVDEDNSESEGDSEGEAEEDLEGVNDADVCNNQSYLKKEPKQLIHILSFSS